MRVRSVLQQKQSILLTELFKLVDLRRGYLQRPERALSAGRGHTRDHRPRGELRAGPSSADGFFALGLPGLRLPLRADVDWRGNPPGSVELSVGSYQGSVGASGSRVNYGLDINGALQEGSNVLRVGLRRQPGINRRSRWTGSCSAIDFRIGF